MSLDIPDHLHPWPPLIAQVLELDSTEVVALIDGAGLVVDWALTSNDDYSNKTRKRAYRPRIDAAFHALAEDSQLRLAWILTRDLLLMHPEIEDQLLARFADIGWRVEEGKLVPTTSPVRELLLTQGTEYDSYLAIKKIIQEARKSLAIVDPYLDGTIFTMLSASSIATLTVQFLSAKLPADFSLEASKFRKQYPQFGLEIRRVSDFHDRFIIVDDARCWHIGASIKDAGTKTFMISEVEDEQNRAALRHAYARSWTASQGFTIP